MISAPTPLGTNIPGEAGDQKLLNFLQVLRRLPNASPYERSLATSPGGILETSAKVAATENVSPDLAREVAEVLAVRLCDTEGIIIGLRTLLQEVLMKLRKGAT